MYTVIDYYEDIEVIATDIENKAEAEMIKRQRIKDTDGECQVIIFRDGEYTGL